MNIFDWEFYLNQYPDLRKNGINTKQKAYAHWLHYGKKEGRICNSPVINSQKIISEII